MPGPSAPPPGGRGRLRIGHVLIGRFLLVGLSTLVSIGVTAAIVWFSVLATDGPDVAVDLSPPTTAFTTAPPPSTELAPSDSTAGSTTTAPAPPTTPVAPVGPSVPGEWPAALAPPTDATVKAGNGAAASQMVLVYETATPVAEVAAAVRAQLASAGFVIGVDSFTPDGSTGSIQATGPGHEATVALSQAPGASATIVSWVLRPA